MDRLMGTYVDKCAPAGKQHQPLVIDYTKPPPLTVNFAEMRSYMEASGFDCATRRQLMNKLMRLHERMRALEHRRRLDEAELESKCLVSGNLYTTTGESLFRSVCTGKSQLLTFKHGNSDRYG